MANVCVITGGGSGMGLEAAKFMPKDKIIVLSGRTVAKLEGAVKELEALGFTAYAKACDTSNRESVKELAAFAASLGEIKNVINAAGVSPAMKGTQESILRINALGTVYVNQEFSKLMNKGSVIVDVSSNSAYILPSIIINKKIYKLAETDEDAFVKKLVKKSNLAKGEYQRKGFAYSLSKNFVVWYAKKCAFEYGLKGIRVVSLSPGLIATDMGNLEKKDGGMLIPFSAEERMGEPAELGYALATVADERNGYLAGVDVLCDGGSTYGMKEFKKKK
ncbi:MAG: SDR family NAD(P)-dependent oxidoreductase [Clostridia bacterium]|nr:SDR family NAD(P)-dependent oxidoreductase [Clostridia bacterium]MBQ3056662.1 SDR family NAD(P)-dependent oxidoreductase [Clostridia bacterium]MBR2463907.1 SDR family NAD(P)-dependent oxidoreductase [Clostridia bacterium]